MPPIPPTRVTRRVQSAANCRPRSSFIGDFGLVEAKGLDLSEGGIGFEIEQDIPFDMEFEIDGELHQHRARMVWMQRLADGRSRFGFQFITAPPSSLLWLYKELGDESQ